MRMTWRNSVDLDLVIAVSVSEIDETKLRGWERDRNRQHRWKAPNGSLLDIVPAPPEAIALGALVWPESGQTMSLAGVSLALNADPSLLGNELSIAVPSIPVIALLKMAAYADRPSSREKDLKDLAHILDEYPPISDDRLYTDQMLETGLHVPQAQAFILGRELRELCSEADRAAIASFFQMTADGVGWSRFVNASPWRNDEEKLGRKLAALRQGLGN